MGEKINRVTRKNKEKVYKEKKGKYKGRELGKHIGKVT